MNVGMKRSEMFKSKELKQVHKERFGGKRDKDNCDVRTQGERQTALILQNKLIHNTQ